VDGVIGETMGRERGAQQRYMDSLKICSPVGGVCVVDVRQVDDVPLVAARQHDVVTRQTPGT